MDSGTIGIELSAIKKYFFAYRNGITADVLKRGGSAFTTIFGVDVASISALARQLGNRQDLACALWQDDHVRESHLLAPWLMDPSKVSVADALELTDGVKDMEDAMMLAFRVLKRMDNPEKLLEILREAPEDSPRHMAAQALHTHLQ